MRYLLNDEYKLCGWNNMPFAVMNTRDNSTISVSERVFRLLFQCSGKREICPEDLSASDLKMMDQLLEKHLIHEVHNGETRTLVYHDYKGMFKDSVHWSITGLCNYHCKHCFQSAPKGVLGQPTLQQCKDIIRQLDECGIRTVSITGGEPLIRTDFFDIVDELLKYNLSIATIYSNGKCVTDAFLDELEKRNLHPAFQISFDGVGSHDWMRGVKGAEQLALDAFRRLKDRGFAASAAMCLCTDNVSSLRETVLTLAGVGCRFLKLQRAMPMGEWMNQKEHFLSFEEIFQAYLDYLPQYKEDNMPLNLQMEGFFLYVKGKGYSNLSDRHGTEARLSHMPPCGVIQKSLYIGPDGSVTPCMSMTGAAIEAQFPNIFEMKLEDILASSSYTKALDYRVSDVFNHTEKCRTCSYRTKCCAGCRATAIGADGTDYLAVDSDTCRVLTEGWSDRLDRIAGKLFEKRGLSEAEDQKEQGKGLPACK